MNSQEIYSNIHIFKVYYSEYLSEPGVNLLQIQIYYCKANTLQIFLQMLLTSAFSLNIHYTKKCFKKLGF
jgi:hypothetical protein